MSTRSTTSRNLLGGFLGGLLGILAFGMFHAALLPVGCLLGVVTGYWYQEIWTGVLKKCDAVQKDIAVLWTNTIVAPRNRFKAWSRKCGWKYLDQNSDLIPYLLYFCLRIAIGMLRLGYKFLRLLKKIACWPMERPINGIYTVTITASIIFVSLLAWLMLPLTWNYEYDYHHHNGSGYGWFAFCAVLFLFPLVIAISNAFHHNCAFTEEMRTESDSKDLRRYGRGGLFYLLSYKFWEIGKAFLFALLAEILHLIYGALGILIVVGFLSIPLVFAMWFVQGVWRFSSMRNHWLCFSVTLIITSVSAFLMSGYLHGTGLWIVAVSTGCLSGILSEVAQRLLHSFMLNRQKMVAWAEQTFEDPFDDLFGPIWKKRWTPLYKLIGWIPNPFAGTFS